MSQQNPTRTGPALGNLGDLTGLTAVLITMTLYGEVSQKNQYCDWVWLYLFCLRFMEIAKSTHFPPIFSDKAKKQIVTISILNNQQDQMTEEYQLLMNFWQFTGIFNQEKRYIENPSDLSGVTLWFANPTLEIDLRNHDQKNVRKKLLGLITKCLRGTRLDVSQFATAARTQLVEMQTTLDNNLLEQLTRIPANVFFMKLDACTFKSVLEEFVRNALLCTVNEAVDRTIMAYMSGQPVSWLIECIYLLFSNGVCASAIYFGIGTPYLLGSGAQLSWNLFCTLRNRHLLKKAFEKNPQLQSLTHRLAEKKRQPTKRKPTTEGSSPTGSPTKKSRTGSPTKKP